MSTKNAQLDWRDGRRRAWELRAWELKEQGWKQTAIAAALGVTPGSIIQWLKRARTPAVGQEAAEVVLTRYSAL
jgi:predicted transcriptional regulator